MKTKLSNQMRAATNLSREDGQFAPRFANADNIDRLK